MSLDTNPHMMDVCPMDTSIDRPDIPLPTPPPAPAPCDAPESDPSSIDAAGQSSIGLLMMSTFVQAEWYTNRRT